jgi:hypothetical protein
VLWASFRILVDSQRLGTALGLMTMLQNVGLTVVNFGAGMFERLDAAGAANPPATGRCCGCSRRSVLRIDLFSAPARSRDGPHGHGLETVRA